MRILVIGSGGREHALVWKLSQSPKVTDIYAYPGNPGIFQLAKPLASSGEPKALAAAAKAIEADLTVIGPEDYLAAGLADELSAVGCTVFGPSRAAAQLETSKSFAKRLMQDNGIPTAEYTVTTELQEALHYIEAAVRPLVVKVDGLAAGKGVLVTDDKNEARSFVRSAMSSGRFGAAGATIVFEEYLEGPEVSALAFVDGTSIKMLPLSQDHKAVLDNDRGPNTGGMGAVAPAYACDLNLGERILQNVLIPTVDGLRKLGIIYQGVIYAGLSLTAHGPKVLEFNCRFGDPETQVLLPLLTSDLADILMACAHEDLQQTPVEFGQGQSSACVVVASHGYPGQYEKGQPVQLPGQLPPETFLFHNGTTKRDDQLVVSGGRVLTASAIGPSLTQALQSAYNTVNHIHFTGKYYRTDIGAKQLRETTCGQG